VITTRLANAKPATIVGGGVLLGIVAGLYAVARIDHTGPLSLPIFGYVVHLPMIVVPTMILGVALVMVSQRSWWPPLAAFFVWLLFEDFFRKFASNDLRLFAMKNILLVVALLGLGTRLRGMWRRPLGPTWLPLMAVLAVAGVMSLPAIVTDKRLPLLALDLRFFFLLLFPVGVFIAQSKDRLQRVFLLLAGLTNVVCGLGFLQRIFGSGFANPSVVDEHLQHLVIEKNIGNDFFFERPPGPFVDATRFAAFTIVGVVIGLCVMHLAANKSQRRFGVFTVTVSLAAALISGGRAAMILSAIVAVFGIMAPASPAQRRRNLRQVLAFGVAGVILVLAFGGAVEGSARDNVTYYAATINPTKKTSDLLPRVGKYAGAVSLGVRNGGVVGRGTGAQSVGRQYLNLDASTSAIDVESGWAGIAIEWGVFGLVIWVWWVFAWVRHAFRAARLSAEAPSGPIALVLAAFLALMILAYFSLGMGQFENYVTNAFFWLFSGMCFAGATYRSDASEDATRRRVLVGAHYGPTA
jgi:hypothetical protein